MRDCTGVFALAIALGFAVLPSAVHASDLAQAHWVGCTSCHGDAGLGSEPKHAPAIAGQTASYLGKQLRDYRAGRRGSHVHDHTGRQMALMAIALPDEAVVDALARHAAALPAHRPAPTLAGADPERGKALYQSCAACHGPKGEGNDQRASPRLDVLQDWYLMAQMRKYRDGFRGTDAGDTSARLMAAQALATSESQWADIAAWLATVRQAP
jgi:cytochrome c oxidase subunit 2